MNVEDTNRRASIILLHVTRADVQCFLLPIVVHQENNYSQYIHFNLPLDWLVYHSPSRYNHLLTLIPKSIIYTKVSIYHFSPFSPLNRPFKVTMTWYFSFFVLVYSQTFIIPFVDVRKTFSPRNCLNNPITTAVAKHYIYLL